MAEGIDMKAGDQTGNGHEKEGVHDENSQSQSENIEGQAKNKDERADECIDDAEDECGANEAPVTPKMDNPE